jgi:acetoin utilization deacetylase AcuC-like enzyme
VTQAGDIVVGGVQPLKMEIPRRNQSLLARMRRSLYSRANTVTAAVKIKTSYSPFYFAVTTSACMRKLPLVAAAVEQAGLAELVDPGFVDTEKLRRLHRPEYVDAFMAGTEPLASSQGLTWSEQVRNGVLATNAGQLLAAENAFRDGIAANIAAGFHRAEYAFGTNFCTFNGLALVAQEFPQKKIFVLDCDEHGGKGTEDFTHRLPNLFNFTIYGSSLGCRGSERSVCRMLPQVTNDFGLYLDALEQAREHIERWRPDLIIYSAGVDAHIDDPLGTLGMTTRQLMERDEYVFAFCRALAIPMFFVLAGGYQEPISERLVPLHVNTFKAAAKIFDGNH